MRNIRIFIYEQINIPEIEMNNNYSIVSDGKYYYLKRKSRFENIEYYNQRYEGYKFYSTDIFKPKKLVSKKHAEYIYYKHIGYIEYINSLEKVK